MSTFQIPIDLLASTSKDTESDIVRANLSNGYVEFTIKDDHIEVRCMGRDIPAINFEPVCANSVNLWIGKSVSRK